MKTQVRICQPLVQRMQQSLRDNEKRTGVKTSLTKFVNKLIAAGLKRKILP